MRMTRRRLPAPPLRRQTGLTLVELMVGLTLGLIVSAALLLLFANASSSGQNLQRASEQIENGRYAVELLRDEIQLAGFFGETASTSPAYSDPDPCLSTPGGFSAAPYTLPAAVRGIDAATALPCLPNRLAGTQALVVRRLGTRQEPVPAPGNTQDYVQYAFCETDPVSTPLVFSRNPSDFVLRRRNCTAPNVVRPYLSKVFFVAACNRCNGDSTPTLKVLELRNGALVVTPLVEGVEMLRFEYGFDTANTGSPATYLPGITAPGSGATERWSNVVAVKAHLITRSLAQAPGTAAAQQFQLGATPALSTPADGHLRRAYSTTIRLVNPSGMRETP